ncbi:MAG: alpha/beta hydrolase [Fuerstiella sp.]|nr:alpha/beta hydrolase [Fuerstiella sp.]
MMEASLIRRRVLEVSITVALLLIQQISISADEESISVTTHTYKTVGDLEIKADVHRADDDRLRPVVVWIHGGALIMGHREGFNTRVRTAMLESGYCLVSIDYRLAPETQLPEIIEDIEDAFTWIHKQGPKLFHADTSRIAVMGGSAGGYLTLMTGYRVSPRPTVLVPFWGYGDLIGDWYSEPSPHQRHHRSKMSKEEAWRQVGGPAIADSRDRKGDGGGFYQYCRQHGSWPHAVSGWDPHTEGAKFIPYMPVKNVTADYPPTLMIHGTHDTDVPYQQSVMMADEFRKYGIDHKLISIQNGEHGLGGGDPQKIEEAYAAAFAFVNSRLAAQSR